MIAEEEDRAHALAPVVAQPFDHSAESGPRSIEVAEEHDQRLFGSAGVDVAVDLLEQLVEQVQPAVDISHDIGDLAFRPAWPVPLRSLVQTSCVLTPVTR